MSAYLDLTADAAAYGIPTGATAAHVVMASGLIDEYLRRPEGLVWAPDYSGRPGWMVGMTPIATFNSTGGILAGANVVVPVTNMFKTTTLLGEVVVLDRTGASPEICTVTAVGTTSISEDKYPGNVQIINHKDMPPNAHSLPDVLDRIADLLRTTRTEKTPLQKQLDGLAHSLAKLAGLIVAAVFVIGLLRATPPEDNLVDAVALAVGRRL